MQLPLQAVHNDLRQVLAVHLVGAVVTDISQRFIRLVDDRRTLIRPHRRNGLTHISNHPGVRDNDLIALITSQIFKLRKHLLRRSEE